MTAGYRKPVQSKTRLLDCYGIEQHSQATIPYLSYRYSNVLDHSHFDEHQVILYNIYVLLSITYYLSQFVFESNSLWREESRRALHWNMSPYNHFNQSNKL